VMFRFGSFRLRRRDIIGPPMYPMAGFCDGP
jgi:hypothetical protein